MADFTVMCEGVETRNINTSTAYAAAMKFAEKDLVEHAMDDDEYDVQVLERSSGKMFSYTVRAQVTTHWIVTRNKDDDDGAA